MKALRSVIIVLVLCSSGCKQVLKSVEETFKPDSAAVSREIQKQAAADSSAKPVATQQESLSIKIEAHISTETHTSTSTTTHTHAPTRESKKFLTDTTRLKKAEKALRALPQFAGKEIFIYRSVHFYGDGNIMLMLRHPENPKYVDNYTYSDGKWSAPTPAQIFLHDDVDSKLVSLDRISFANAARVARVYNGKAAEVEGAKQATTVYVSIWDKRMRWFPGTINGTRERYDIQFNEDGSLKSFRQE
ncbi:hypothetical protein [Chitinophaga sp. GbtcB8]|uniref:hypothetical protein n=1 Tax=Chitinophaga sp. GbtcB8 TaxID=2824753 RepID=UPI001C2FFE8C|nr:hypothetical protein [Chitinophaga sp. GbtcB8]